MPSPRPCHRVGDTAIVHVQETAFFAICEGGSVLSARRTLSRSWQGLWQARESEVTLVYMLLDERKPGVKAVPRRRCATVLCHEGEPMAGPGAAGMLQRGCWSACSSRPLSHSCTWAHQAKRQRTATAPGGPASSCHEVQHPGL